MGMACLRSALEPLGNRTFRGIHTLFQAVTACREDGSWLRIEPDLAPQVQRVLRLVRLEDFLVGDDSDGH